ncbi:MAG TPA: CDP-alcohol phosphatidyltransferase family protein [Stellaceae bacterium]
MPEGPAVPAMSRQWGLSRLDVNLPNLITLGRLLCVPVAIWLILGERYGLAFWVFVAAGVSDALDGWIAKRWDQRTPLGALLDPIADKALLAAVYITLGFAGELPHWLVILVVLRDLLIVGGYLLSHGVNAPEPLFISKVNTLVQIALVGFVLARLGLGIDEALVTSSLIAAAGVTTVWSGLSYLVRWARFLVRWN